ncbi:MAG: prepilin-type N-terminal cleavage/methylation domain-containing protein [Woeseiaceae bacterium]
MACIINHTRKSSPNNLGFTLVELIVVILIVGILSASIAPRFFGVASYEDRKATDELLSALRYSQQLAMARGGNIQLNLQNDNYTIELTGGKDLRSPDGSPYPHFFNGVTTSTPNIIVYDRLGRRVPNNQLDINIGSKTIRIEQETGYAHQL